MEAIGENVLEVDPVEELGMGKVRVNIELVNIFDEEACRQGILRTELIRSINVPALVDTGSTLLSLPEADIVRLGLPIYSEAVSRFANGQKAVRKIYGPVTLKILGRKHPVAVVAGHPGTSALLGQIPLEGLDLMVDCNRQRLIPGHPDHPNEPMYEMY